MATEAVQVEFDPATISYEKLLEVLWAVHDPTQLNRQGPDVGTQYRSAVFYLTPEQEKAAVASKEQAQAGVDRPIVTEITPASTFWPAEEYHQRYFEKHGMVGCAIPVLE
jgi:peptide-methionine (S)-S-oxide reductase